jgi:hypothetical protein
MSEGRREKMEEKENGTIVERVTKRGERKEERERSRSDKSEEGKGKMNPVSLLNTCALAGSKMTLNRFLSNCPEHIFLPEVCLVSHPPGSKEIEAMVRRVRNSAERLLI